MDLQEFIEEMEYDYDGLILDEGATGGYGEEVVSRGLSYVIFSSEQAKNTDNLKPTKHKDIRYSKKSVDNDGGMFSYDELVAKGDLNGVVIGEVEDYADYNKPITLDDIMTLRTIGRKSINAFTSEEIKRVQKWAYKFYKELGVKSPFFRAWFGEWRKYDYETRIPYVPVNSATIERTMVPRGDFSNDDTKWEITSNSDGIDETANKEHKRSDSYHALKDIDSMIKHAILLDTVAVAEPSKRLGKNAAFMHHMYCPVEIDGEKGIAKLYIAESLGDKRKFYLVRIEKAPTAMGFITEDSESTPRSNATTVDADISIAEIIDFVKVHNEGFEKNSEYPTTYSPVSVNEHFINKPSGEPKVFYLSKKANYDFVEGVRVYENKSDIKSGEVIPVYVSSVTAGNVVLPQIQSDGSVIVYDSEQIKALDNVGTFDRKTINIKRSGKAESGVNLPLLNRSQFKIYTKENAEQIISSITLNALNFNDGTQGTIKNKSELVEMMWRRLNSAEAHKRGGVALDLAEEVLQRVAVKAIYDDPNNAQYIEELNTIKEYLHKFNLDDIKGEIEHKFGKKQAQGIMLVWGAKKGERGLSPDTVAQELTSRGLSIDAENDADCFFEIYNMYSKAREALKRRSETMLDTVIPENERKELKQAIAKEISNEKCG